MAIFNITRINDLFLYEPSSSWNTLESYKDTAIKFQQLQVKNDAAVRGVKLGHSFLERATIEKNYQDILQSVEKKQEV